MSSPDERPMSGSTFVLMTVLMILGAFLLLRWFLGTVAYVVNTLVLVVVIGGAAYLYLKLRASKR